jgi:hypothetical protein
VRQVGVEPLRVSLFDVISKRGATADIDLPQQASDEELLAWSTTLAAASTRRAPLRAAPQKRPRPLVADPA